MNVCVLISESQKVTAKTYKSRFALPEGRRTQVAAPKQQVPHDKGQTGNLLHKA